MEPRRTTMPATVTRHRFTVREYHRMGEAGVFHEEDRVELIDGEILVMTPIGARHAACVTALQEAFAPLRGRVLVRVQNPVELDDHSEPQPDVCVVARRESLYADRHPGPSEVRLLVEVADSSQAYDREFKLPRYARSGIREVWIVDLAADRVEVYRDPESEEYRTRRALGRGESIAPAAHPEVEIAADAILV
jgi:Uma2 family endonuclease